MGKGDTRTRRGKTFSASYGNSRPKSSGKKSGVKSHKPASKTGK